MPYERVGDFGLHFPGRCQDGRARSGSRHRRCESALARWVNPVRPWSPRTFGRGRGGDCAGERIDWPGRCARAGGDGHVDGGRHTYAATLPATLTDLWLNGPLVSRAERSSRQAAPVPPRHLDLRSVRRTADRASTYGRNCLDGERTPTRPTTPSLRSATNGCSSSPNVNHKYLARCASIGDRRAAGVLRVGTWRPLSRPRGAAVSCRPWRASPERKSAGVSGTWIRHPPLRRLTVPMPAHSAGPSSRPYPDWTAQFLVHKTAASARM